MTNYQVYQERKLNSTQIWITFLLLGWSYGSMNQMGKQIFFYLTFGGFGLWTLYRLFSLNESIRAYNKKVAVGVGLTEDEIKRLGLKNY